MMIPKLTNYKDEKTAFEDGAVYVIYYKELFHNGTWRNHLLLRHAFSLDQAYRNFVEECQAKGIDFQVYRIFQAYEMRRFIYEDPDRPVSGHA